MTAATGYALVALTIALTVFGQFIVKWQASTAGALPADLPGRVMYVVELLLRPWMIVGLGSAFLAAICWMLALTKLPISHAYPFTAATFVLVVLGGAWIFSEPLSIAKIVALGFIVVGVVLAGW